MIMHSRIVSLFTFASLLVSSNAAAGTLSAAGDRLASEIGKQSAITATKTCDLTNMSGNDGGNLGTVNQMLCYLKNTGLAGTTGTTGTTATITVGTSTIQSHTVVSAPGPTIDGVTYDYEVKVWTCGTGCTTVTAFLPAMYMAYSANSSDTINKGILINHFSANTGTIKGTAFIKWDTGSATTTKTFDLVMVDCSSSPTTAIRAAYTRTGDKATMNDLVSQSTGSVTRTALGFDWTANTGNWYQDTTVSAGGDSPTWSGGFTRAASGTDYTYSAASTSSSFTINPFTTAISGTTLSGSTFQGATCNASSGVASVAVGTGVLSTVLTSATNGMTTNPPNI